MSDVNRLSKGVKVELKNNFKIVKETLERMGIIDRKRKIIWPSCYCINGKEYDADDAHYIVHFKELFELDGRDSTLSDKDKLRRDTIVWNLQNWDIVEAKDEIDEILVDKIDVLKYEEKEDFTIDHKYVFVRKVN